MDIAGGLLLSGALGFLLLVTAYIIAATQCERLPTLTRWAATVVVLAGLCTAIFHLLAWERAFNRGTVLACTALTAAITWIRSGGAQRVAWLLRRDRLFARRVLVHALHSPYRFIAASLLLLALPAAARAIVLPPLGWDALTYHAVKAAMWVQHGGGIVMNGPGPWAYYANMPAGAEVLQAWTMLPMTSDAFTTWLDVIEWLAFGLAVIIAARSVGVKEPLPSVAAAFVLSIPSLHLMLGSGYSEPFLLSMLFIGLALVLNAERGGRALLVGSLALGLSASAKVSVLPVAGVALMLAVVRWTMQGHDKRIAAAALLTFAVPVLPWFAINAMTTGLPFSPFDIHVGGLKLGASPPEYLWYVDRVVPPTFSIPAELRILEKTFTWPWNDVDAPGVLCLLPLVAMWPGLVRLLRRNLFGAILIAAVLAACVGFYFSRGFAPIRFTFPQNSGRFLLPAIAAATVLTIAGVRPRSLWSRAVYALLATCAAWYYIEFALKGFSPISIRASAAVLLAAAVMAGTIYLTQRLRIRSWRMATTLATVCTAMLALVFTRDLLRQSLLHNDYALHWFADWRYWADAATIMDVPGQHLRLAVTGGAVQNQDNWFVYPFLGRRLQNEVLYVPPTGDGRLRPYDGEHLVTLAASSNYWAWRMRLERQHVTHVMSFRPMSIELGWMDAHRESFERLSGQPGDWGLFAVRPGSAAIAN